MEPRSIGVWIIGAGVAVVLVGVVVYAGGLSWFGRLPGDIRYQGERTSVFVPITSMLVVSAALTLLVNLCRRLL